MSGRTVMGRIALGLTLCVTPAMAQAAEPAPTRAPDTREVELQTLYVEAQQRVGQYNATQDVAQLVVARELLSRWLVGHANIYGNSAVAVAQRETIEQQLGLIDAELARVAAPTPAPVPVGAAPQPQSEPPPPVLTAADRERLALRRESRAWTWSGAGLLTVGVATTLGISVPLWVSRNNALRDAQEEEFRADQERIEDKARRRQAGAIATLAVGVPLTVVGTALMVVGGHKRAQSRRVSVSAGVGRGSAGAAMTFRW